MISIAILFHREGDRILDCLASVLHQNNLKEIAVEVLLIGNCPDESTDRTVGDFLRRADLSLFKVFYFRESNNIAAARNVAVNKAQGSQILFIDGDCIAPKHWLSRISERFAKLKEQDATIAGLSGGAQNIARSSFAEALILMQRSFWGHLNSPQARPLTSQIEADHLPTMNVIFCLSTIRKVQGFDENFYFVCEDVDLGYRLQKAGYRLLMEPGFAVEHIARETIGEWSRRMWRFGFGQTIILTRHWQHFKFRTIAPALFLPLIFLSIVLGVVTSSLFFLIPILYVLTVLYVAFEVSGRPGRLYKSFWVGIAFALTHFSYSLGEVQGFLTRKK